MHPGGDDDDDDEGGAVGVPLYLIVNPSRIVRELSITRRGFASPGSCGADAQLYFKRRRRENGFNKQRLAH